MKKYNNVKWLLLFVLFTVAGTACSTRGDPGIEQSKNLLEKGKLIIVGGAMRDTTIFNTFLRFAGGNDAPIVVIPTAMADTITNEMLQRTKERMFMLGATNVTVLHTKDREEANSPEFFDPVMRANGVWFTGGRQWRIADSYLGTLTQQAFDNVLRKGGVIGGSSAGATIQGSYLARGDTKTNVIMMGDHEEGFGFLPGVAIDQHLLRRNRQFDLIEIIEAKPDLLGLGIDENTALVVQGDEFEVIGNGYVAVYDAGLWNTNTSPISGKFFLLSAGDKYNWKSRKVTFSGGNNRNIFGN